MGRTFCFGRETLRQIDYNARRPFFPNEIYPIAFWLAARPSKELVPLNVKNGKHPQFFHYRPYRSRKIHPRRPVYPDMRRADGP